MGGSAAKAQGESDMMPDSEAILARLESLERENRRWRRIAIAALALVAGVVVLGAARPAPSTITAHQILLTDNAGNLRGKLTAIDGKFPSLTLYDGRGQAMLSLKGGGPQPGLAVSDASGKTSVMLGGLSPNLSFYDDAGDTTVSLDGDALGPRLLLFDEAGKMRVHLGGPEPSLDLMDRSGYETDIGVSDAPNRVTGDIQRTSAASIVMFKREGEGRKVIWRAP